MCLTNVPAWSHINSQMHIAATHSALEWVSRCDVEPPKRLQTQLLGLSSPQSNAGDVRDTGSIPGSGRSPAGGNGNPLQYSCLRQFLQYRGAWWAHVGPWRHKDSDTTEATKHACLSD